MSENNNKKQESRLSKWTNSFLGGRARHLLTVSASGLAGTGAYLSLAGTSVAELSVTSVVANVTTLAAFSTPLAAALAATVGTGLLLNHLLRPKKEAADLDDDTQKRLKDIKNQLQKKSKNTDNLKLELHNDKLVEKLIETFQFKGMKSEEYPKVETLEIDVKGIKEQGWRNLLETNIGKMQIKSLVIKGGGDLAHLLPCLKNAVLAESFRDIKTLDLSSNAISLCPSEIDALNQIGRKTKIEKLVLSDNSIGTYMNVLDENTAARINTFFSTLYKNFPYLTALELKNAGIANENTTALESLFASMTSLEVLNIEGNSINVPAMKKLIRSNAFQSNISIKDLVTHSKNTKVKKLLQKRKEHVAALQEKIGGNADESFTLKILDKLTSARRATIRNHLIEHIEVVCNTALEKKGALAKWESFAQALVGYKVNNKLTLDKFALGLRKMKDTPLKLDKILLAEKLELLQGRRANENIEMVLNDSEVTIHLTDDRLKELVACFEQLADRQRPVIIKNIDLSKTQLSDESFNALLDADITRYRTESMSLANNALTDESIVALSQLAQDDFSDLKHLDLSGNQLTANSLFYLLKFCKNKKIETLNLSNNAIIPRNNVEENCFKKFMSELSKEMPYLKQINISDIGLTSDSLPFIAPVFTNVSLLEKITLSQKSIRASKAFSSLLENKAFQNNLNLKTVHTGRNSVRSIKRMLDKKAENIALFVGSLSEEEQQSPITCVLLNRFLHDRNDPAIPAQIKVLLKQRDRTSTYSAWDLLQIYSDKLRFQNIHAIDENSFIEFKKNEPMYVDASLADQQRAIENAADNAQVDLLINTTDQRVRIPKATLLPFLHNTLQILTERQNSPVIKHIMLNHLSIIDAEFDDLVVNGLGNYRTEMLTLQHNQLTDSFADMLADMDKDSFENLKCLDLSHNNFTAKGLVKISEFCARVGVEKLVLNHNPVISNLVEDRQPFIKWTSKLNSIIPSLQSLEIQEIGLNSRDAMLCLKPMLNQLSLLKSIKIDDKKLPARVYAEFVKETSFKANLGLSVQSGKDNLRNIKRHLDEKKQVSLALQKHGLHVDAVETPYICSLLQLFMVTTHPVLPETLNRWLDQRDINISGSFLATQREKLSFMARNLMYFRNRAKLRNPQLMLPNAVSEKEYIALMQDTLENFWPAPQQIVINPQERQKLYEDYKSSPSTESINALELYRLNILGDILVIYWGADDSIRILNHAKNTQFIISRYHEALQCEWEKPCIIPLVHGNNQSYIRIDVTGYISVLHQNNLFAKIKGAESEVANQRPQMLTLDPKRYVAVDDYRQLYEANQPRPNPSQIPQFARFRAQSAEIRAQDLAEENNPRPRMNNA